MMSVKRLSYDIQHKGNSEKATTVVILKVIMLFVAYLSSELSVLAASVVIQNVVLLSAVYFIVMQNVIILSAVFFIVTLSVISLRFVLHNAVILNVIHNSQFYLFYCYACAIALAVIMLNVIILSAVSPSDIMISVLAP
jgi:hypothetical protein